ncbi:hypothetical protein H0H93_008409, partial [Arthromyces matolae]
YSGKICALQPSNDYKTAAVLRNMNDKNAQLQKQLENVIREANSEISLLNGKAGGGFTCDV